MPVEGKQQSEESYMKPVGDEARISYYKQQIQEDIKKIEREYGPLDSLLSQIFPKDINNFEERAAISTTKQADQTDFQAISASKLTLSNSFYNNAFRQSQQSFLWALIFAGAGALFIILTVTLVIVLQPTIATSVIIALLGGTGGIGAGAISYRAFQLYKEASDKAAACHIRLDRTSDFILANSACEGLSEPEKQQMRSEIIRNLFE